MTQMRRKFLIPALATAIALGLFAFQALPALACGGLVAPNGAVRLSRATTFVAWHDGIERYLTAFTYQGDVSNLGLIAPPLDREKIYLLYSLFYLVILFMLNSFIQNERGPLRGKRPSWLIQR